VEVSLKLFPFNLGTNRTKPQFNPITCLFNLLMIVTSMLIFSANSNGVLAALQPQPVAADTEPPTVTITSPITNQSFFAGAMTLALFRSSDNVGVVSQNVLISTDGINFIAIFRGLDGRITSLDFMLPNITSLNVVLRVEALDAAGNTGFALVNNLSLLADMQPPTVTIIAPQANMKLKGNTMFTIIFRSADNVSIASHEIRIALDGADFTPFISGIEGEAQSHVVQVPNIKAKAALIRVIAIDTAGNIGMADSGAFKIKRVK
jgi:hypothetical protein